jgi:hypothetical protein
MFKISHQAIQKRAKKENWGDGSDYAEPDPLFWDDSELSFKLLLVSSLRDGSLCKAYDLAPCLKVVREFKIPGAFVDIVSFHADGSISVFEAKRAGLSLRDYMTGIGQLMHASVQFGMAFSITTRHVRYVLATPTATDAHVGFACLAAGIEYMPFGTIEEYNQIKREMYGKANP